MKKVLLLQPPVSFKEKAFALVPNCPHLGLLYLAASLIREGFNVRYCDISDNSLSVSEVKSLIEDDDISILCITAMTQNIKGAVQLARFLKEKGVGIKIILGGPHVSADPTLIERFPYFDVAITGESELTLPKVVKDIFSGKPIKGVIKGETPLDLNDLPFPARHIVDHDIYFRRGLSANGIFATRGCPYHCNFCSIPAIDKRVRFRSPKLIADEMKECYALTGVKKFNFSDDALTIDKNFVYSLCDEIQKLPFSALWEAQSRINYVDRPLLRVMRKAGCRKLLFGIESGNERIRNQIIGKNVTDEQIANSTKLCWDEKIEPDHYLMMGQPTETKNEILDTINCSLRFKPNIIGIFITMPLPGSPLFLQAIEEGVIEEEVIDKFIRGDYGQGYQGSWPYYVPKGLTQNELIGYRNLAYRKFYFRPEYILRRIGQDCTSLVKLKRDLREGLSLFIKNRPADDFNIKKSEMIN
ncbi:B12-binding domain-containing radical SAM protein [Thermoproteota archaeon]